MPGEGPSPVARRPNLVMCLGVEGRGHVQPTDPEPESDLAEELRRRYGGDRWFVERAVHLLSTLDRLYADRRSDNLQRPLTQRRRVALSAAQTVILSLLAALGALIGVLVGALLAVQYGLCP